MCGKTGTQRTRRATEGTERDGRCGKAGTQRKQRRAEDSDEGGMCGIVALGPDGAIVRSRGWSGATPTVKAKGDVHVEPSRASGRCITRPGRAKACRHGWNKGAAKPARAQPVERARTLTPPRPGRRKSPNTHAHGSALSPPRRPLLRPSRGGSPHSHPPHGLRSAQSRLAPPVAKPHRPVGAKRPPSTRQAPATPKARGG